MSRPRRSSSATPRATVPEPLLELTHALEDLHAAAKTLGLPAMRVDWEDGPPGEEEASPELLERRRYIEAMFADYEGIRLGPPAWPINQLQPPENPDEYLLEGLIRPGTTIMLSGPPGAAKSWASRQLGLSAAGGLPTFLDRYPITRKLNVLVVDEDNGPDEEWRREERLLPHLELRREDLGNYRRASLEGVQLDKESWQRWLRGQIRTWDLDLVILDPISEFHGGKELREDPEFRSLLAFLKRLKVDFPRLATVLVHHTRKLSASDRTSSRGLEDVRGQWGQTPDVVVLLSPLGERRSKWETHKRVPHSSLLLEQSESGALSKVADETTGQTRRQTTDGRVLGAIRAGATTGEEIRIGTGLSKQGVYKALRRLSDAGLVSRRAPFELLRDSDDPIDELEEDYS